MAQQLIIEKVTDGYKDFSEILCGSYFYINEDICLKLNDEVLNNAWNFETKELISISSVTQGHEALKVNLRIEF